MIGPARTARRATPPRMTVDLLPGIPAPAAPRPHSTRPRPNRASPAAHHPPHPRAATLNWTPANSYEYLSLVEGYREEGGKPRQRTLFRLGEASRLRASGELDRIIDALTAHAERRFIDVDELEAEAAPAIGGIAAVKVWWDKLGLDRFFEKAGRRLSWSLQDAVFAMTANRLLDPASKRKTVRWIEADVVAPDGFTFPTLEQYYRALDRVHDLKSEVETFL